MRWLRWFGYTIASLVLLIGLLVGAVYARYTVENNADIASWRGERNARRDLSHGVYREIILGLPIFPAFTYQKEMKAR
jgi:hypothetical protein